MKVLFFILFTILMFQIIYANENEENLTAGLMPIDAVLVLDVSLSMQTADPYQISREAMNLFIDMLTEGRDRVGIVSYAGQVEASLDLTKIYGDEEREMLQNFIQNLNYASWTDHGLGLLEATKIMYENHDPDRQQVIIFFTDGNMNTNPNIRSNDAAQDDVNHAIYLVQQQGYPIYTIGLNFDGNLDIEAITLIAEETGGLVFETSNANDLPHIIRAIFSAKTPAPALHDIQEYIDIFLHTTNEEEPFEEIRYEPTYTSYINKEILEKINYDNYETNNLLWISTGVLVGIFILVLFIWLIPNKNRVFSGQLFISIYDINNRKVLIQKTINLIEYGKKTTLFRLVGAYNILNEVKLSPCYSTPSHLPKLYITSTKMLNTSRDFIPIDLTKGISISSNSQLTIMLDDVKVDLKYFD